MKSLENGYEPDLFEQDLYDGPDSRDTEWYEIMSGSLDAEEATSEFKARKRTEHCYAMYFERQPKTCKHCGQKIHDHKIHRQHEHGCEQRPPKPVKKRKAKVTQLELFKLRR